MNNPELASLEASLQTLIRQAYDLGRRDALKKVVDVLNSERPSGEPLALMAPEGTTQAEMPTTHDMTVAEPVEEAPPAPEMEEANKPWWARR